MKETFRINWNGDIFQVSRPTPRQSLECIQILLSHQTTRTDAVHYFKLMLETTNLYHDVAMNKPGAMQKVSLS